MQKAQRLPPLKPPVDVAQLVDADIDAAARYNELMTRHNALVDWVDSVLKQQAKHP
jgi:hypothetical protein